MSQSAPETLSAFDATISGVRIALVHEWLSGIAGSEQTFVAMAEQLPGAELFALSFNETRGLDFNGRTITTSRLNRFAQNGGSAALLPLMPAAMQQLGHGRDFDVVISSSHAFSRAFAASSRATHLSYTYTPVRYVWYPELERHRSRLRVPRAVLKRFQAADRRFAQRVDSFAAISHEVRDRIRFVYGRDSRVVYPPCDTDFFAAAEQPAERSGVVVAGRLVPYKRVDLAIEACARAGVDLTVVGEGPERDRLEALAKRLAPGRVHFLGGVSRNDLRSTMASAAALVFPGREDFGIVPVEAQAAGTPVIAFGAAGALDTVVDHPGSLVPTQTPEAFAKALETVLADPPSGEACRHRAAEFSRQNFDAQFRAWVTDTLSPGAV